MNDSAPTPEALVAELKGLHAQHPQAGQAHFRAQSAEGRHKYAPAKGDAQRARLAASPLVQRARVAWNASTLGLLVDAPRQGALPAALVETFARLITAPDLESQLARALEGLDAR